MLQWCYWLTFVIILVKCIATSCIVGGNKLIILLQVFYKLVVCALEMANENSLQESGDVQLV